MLFLRTLLLASALVFSGIRLAAQTTIGWDFGTSSGSLSATLNVPVAHLTVSSITSFTGQTLSNASSSVSSGYEGASGAFNASLAAVSGSFNAATSSAFVFTLTPESGYTVSLSSISFGTRTTASGPTNLSLRSSADGYATDLFTTTAGTASTWGLVSTGSLSSITGTSASPLTVRLYGFGGSSASAGNWRIDDLSVTLNVTAVPEPAAYALGAGLVALLGVIWLRRRNRPAIAIAAPN